MEGFMEPTNFRTPERWNSVPVPARVAERATTRIDKREDGCWISRYSTASHGYAQIGWQTDGDRHVVLAHRAAWTFVNGQVPLGMTLDHTCKTKRCVNPDHLRLLPNYENARRTKGDDWPMGFCKNGHPNSELVTVTASKNRSGVARNCRVCLTEYRARWVRENPDKVTAAWKRSNSKRKR